MIVARSEGAEESNIVACLSDPKRRVERDQVQFVRSQFHPLSDDGEMLTGHDPSAAEYITLNSRRTSTQYSANLSPSS